MKLLFRFADFAFHEIDDSFGLGHGIILGQGPDDNARAVEQNDRRRDAFAFGIGDDLRFAVGIDVRHRAKGRAKVDSNYFSSSHVWVCVLVKGETQFVFSVCAIFMPRARGKIA